MNTTQNKTALINAQTLEQRLTARKALDGPQVGDYLKIKYGIYTRFTHVWDESDQIQTGGCSDSFYLGNSGYCSYSGGLDSGVKISDLIETKETKEGLIWFFSENYATAHNGVNYTIPCKVYELKEGANTEGLPQIKAYEHAKFMETVPTFERFNGNGNLYTLHIPKITILCDLNEYYIKDVEKQTGLKFTASWNGYSAQPTTFEQVVKLFVNTNFETKYYDNGTNKNELILKFNR